LAAMWVTKQVVPTGIMTAPPYLAVDALGALVILLTATIGAASTWFSIRLLQHELAKGIIGFRRIRQHHALLQLFLAALFVAAATNSLMLMWVAIEATTLATALLISFYHRPAATEAAWKYLVINSVGLLISLLGIMLFLTNARDPAVIKIAFVLILVGYGTKAGIVPLHTWKPDAYSLVPAPIGAVMSTALLNVALMAIVRFAALTDSILAEPFTAPILLGFGVLSAVTAAALLVAQRNYKRLLAYSSIEHTGLMLCGIALGHAGTFIALLHMFYHTLAKSALFLASGNILIAYSSTKISAVRGLLHQHPLLAAVVIAASGALLGLPPFGLFVTELSLLLYTIQLHPALGTILVLALAAAFAGFARHLSAMLFSPPPSSRPPQLHFTITDLAAPAVLLALALLASWYLPAPLQSLLATASHLR
ncbi:MAG TPA: proton-conducting transporter membrane subunit, partial [Candidatus Andersenbacteria bacterium]|nr:proton-conducting transporter membrane subunit [Candidatus Andersenbacteria bacterium]